MLLKTAISILVTVALTCSTGAAGTTAIGEGQVATDTAVARANLPSVVTVNAEFKLPLRHVPSTQTVGSRTSGFIVSKDGYIVTANHGIQWKTVNGPAQPADTITVNFYDGSKAEAKVAAIDSRNDLAILKVEKNKLKPVTLGDPSLLKPGMAMSWIYFKAGDETPSISQGTVTSVNQQLGPMTNLLELTGRFHLGAGGGLVLDPSGKAVGMITGMMPDREKGSSSDLTKTPQIASGSTGYAIPITLVKSWLETLKGKRSR